MKKNFICILFLCFFNIFGEANSWELGVETNYSGYMKLDNYSHGIGLGAIGQYNFTDFWGSTIGINYNKHLSDEKYDIINLYGGVVYNLDILRLVPIFEAGIGVTLLNNYELNDNFYTINGYIGFSLSYLISWSRSIALFIRYETSLKDADEVFDSYFTIGIRYNFKFEN